jgi:hypothetical protein
MATQFYASGMIPKLESDSTLWLGRWSERQAALDFVRGRRLGEESFRECVDREVGWELGLRRDRDYLVANMAQLNLEFPAVLPGDSEPSHVAVAFYVVNLYGKAAWRQVESDPANRWLSGRELHQGRGRDGRPVSPLLSFLLKRADVIHEWD